LKNEATDLLDNKGSGCGKVRNEANVQAAERRHNLAQGESRWVGTIQSCFFHPSLDRSRQEQDGKWQKANGKSEEQDATRGVRKLIADG